MVILIITVTCWGPTPAPF